MLQGLTITSGLASGTNNGGAILVGNGSLTLQKFAITNCSASQGGAIKIGMGGSLLIEDSTLSGNSATGSGGDGGAIDVDSNVPVTVRRSTLSGNTAVDSGGAIYFFSGGSLTVENSTLSGNIANSPTGMDGGGAVYFFGTPTNFLISNSTLSGNSAPTGSGGAVSLRTFSGTAVIQNSTVSGNSAGLNGGGIARTGGTGVVSLSNTIVAGNTNANTPDLSFDAASNIAGNNNLIGVAGVGNFTLTGTGNQSGIIAAPLDAKLDILADSGGPTLTHALLAGSPAIDAGDPNAVAGVGDVPQFDQRGFPFTRVIDGDGAGPPRIDIGAFELHLIPSTTPALLGDYNLNGVVDAPDYVMWRKSLGTGGLAAFSGADGSGNGQVGAEDHGVWRANFGNALPPPAEGSGAAAFVFGQSAFEVDGEAIVPALGDDRGARRNHLGHHQRYACGAVRTSRGTARLSLSATGTDQRLHCCRIRHRSSAAVVGKGSPQTVFAAGLIWGRRLERRRSRRRTG